MKGGKNQLCLIPVKRKRTVNFPERLCWIPKGGIKKANHISFRSVGIREKKDVEESRMDYMRKSSWKRI